MGFELNQNQFLKKYIQKEKLEKIVKKGGAIGWIPSFVHALPPQGNWKETSDQSHVSFSD